MGGSWAAARATHVAQSLREKERRVAAVADAAALGGTARLPRDDLLLLAWEELHGDEEPDEHLPTDVRLAPRQRKREAE